MPVIKLNLGCCDNVLEDYINIDLHSPKADLIHDLTTPLPYTDSTVDEILADHIIEHFTDHEWVFVRKDWARVLKPGGKITISCPDLKRCAKYLLADKRPERWLLAIFGGYKGQGEAQGQLHKTGFWLDRLRKDLNSVGIEVHTHWYLKDRKPTDTGFNIAVEGEKVCN